VPEAVIDDIALLDAAGESVRAANRAGVPPLSETRK
jgi:hypothetical protein